MSRKGIFNERIRKALANFISIMINDIVKELESIEKKKLSKEEKENFQKEVNFLFDDCIKENEIDLALRVARLGVSKERINLLFNIFFREGKISGISAAASLADKQLNDSVISIWERRFSFSCN